MPLHRCFKSKPFRVFYAERIREDHETIYFTHGEYGPNGYRPFLKGWLHTVWPVTSLDRPTFICVAWSKQACYKVYMLDSQYVHAGI